MNKKSLNNLAKLGMYLKDLRLDLGLSIRNVAKLADISPAHLCKIEQGNKFSSIGLEIILKLSKIYRIPVNAILYEAGLIEETDDHLPPLAQHLRQKYHLNYQAIRDMEIALDIVRKKYQNENPGNSRVQNNRPKLQKQQTLSHFERR